MKIIQYTRDGSKAVVIARDVAHGYFRLSLHTGVGDWSGAEYFTICECRETLTPRVLAMEPSETAAEKTMGVVDASILYRDVLANSLRWNEAGNAKRKWLSSMEGLA